MKQQIKCIHCKKWFPVEESLKHEHKEIRKRFQAEEEKKSKERQKEIEKKFNSKLEKLRKENEKKQEEEAKKQADTKILKFKKEHAEQQKQIKEEVERKSKKEIEILKEKLAKQEKAHQIDVKRIKEKHEEAARSVSQSPVERKGEVQEELIEEFLKKEFPHDKYEAVKKGKRGADVIQFVQAKNETVGKILYESKDVLNFDEKWVSKLIDDMTRENATVGIIFTKAMPKKSNGLVEEREGGRVVICSEYPILRQIVSTNRKLIQQIHLNQLSKKDASLKLQTLYDYLNSNEFKLQYRKTINGIRKEGLQIEKDERSNDISLKNRKKNYEENKKNVRSIMASIVSNADLPEDLLDVDEDDLLLE